MPENVEPQNLDQQIGLLIGRLDAFMESEKEARLKLDETVSKLAVTMLETTSQLRSDVDAAHGRIKNLFTAVKAIGGTLGVVGTGLGWLWSHGRAAIDVGEKIINHK